VIEHAAVAAFSGVNREKCEWGVGYISNFVEDVNKNQTK